MTDPASKLRCLLCSGHDLVAADELTGRDIVALWRAVGREFSPAALAPMDDTTRVTLWRCRACGFQFYDPRLAGGGKFYEELMAREYYVEQRPEFPFTLRLAREQGVRSVLDVGGGDGVFLDQARQQGLTTWGVELNEAAAERASAKGHRMIRKPLEQITPEEAGGGVDLLTLYQVVEHVPDPVGFVREAARLVRPGGLIVIAVPHEYRICGLIPLDPANWPPHHLSRWRKRDLRALVELLGLELVSLHGDRLHGSDLEQFIPMHNRLAAAIGRRTHPLDETGARWLSFFYRKLGAKYFFPRLGLSLCLVARRKNTA